MLFCFQFRHGGVIAHYTSVVSDIRVPLMSFSVNPDAAVETESDNTTQTTEGNRDVGSISEVRNRQNQALHCFLSYIVVTLTN